MKNSDRIESFIDFLFYSQKYGTFTEAEKTDPNHHSHDTWRRELINLQEPQNLLWERVKKFVQPKKGYLIADDTILDKPFGKTIECVGFHRSGKHKRVVRGICLVTLLWSDGKRSFPIDFRIYHNDDGIFKNEHLRDMLRTAKQRGFSPRFTMFDSWYSSNETLRLLKKWKWLYMVGIKSNRCLEYSVGRIQKIKTSLSRFFISKTGLLCSLRGLGLHRCFSRRSSPPGTRYWCTNHTQMSRADWKELNRISFSIETYHRSLKQHCLVERCQSRRRDIQSAYIALCLCAFVKMEVSRHSQSMTLYEYHRIFFRDIIKRLRRKIPKKPLYGQTHVFCGFQ